MTILIIDDNPSVRRLLRRAILSDATSIWECSDGAEAQRAYLEYRPDFVLMDIRMPRMDGLEATKKLRRTDPEAKVVIVTDYDDDDIRSAANEAGASGYILKQNLMELTQLLRSLATTPTDRAVLHDIRVWRFSATLAAGKAICCVRSIEGDLVEE
jgi:DNA-binding NarL/FixJ family response regulator